MTSSSADCTLAGARLISSASRKLWNTGPSWVSKPPVSGRHTRVPTRSAGTRAGGNGVRGDRDAAVAAAQHGGQRLDGQRLGQAGNALQEHVTSGEQTDEQPL